MRRLPLALLALAALTGSGAPALAADADDRRILHVLNRLAFGPRPGDLARVRAAGLEAWIDRQLHPELIDDRTTEPALAALASLRMSIPEALREYPRPDPKLREKFQNGEMTRQEMMEMYPPEKRPFRIAAEREAAKVLRAVESERQLQEVMVDFWFNHFNVFAGKGDVRWYVSAYERDVIRPNALGRFGDLVRASARHPAMLFYLDNWLSTRSDFTARRGPNAGRKAGLNENYARELMELHTLGVNGGYTQRDVTEVARAFTGWSIDRPRVEGRFVFRPLMHDTSAKVVLGHPIPAGGGQEDGEQVLAILTRHPSTARFIATKLARRFVADAPPEALVERVAATYLTTDGDIRAMLRTIVASDEFWSDDAYRAKVKKPLEFVASAVRALGAGVDAPAALDLARATAEIGEPLYQAQPPTGYPDRAEAWVSSGALLARMNFALALTGGRYPLYARSVSDLVSGAGRETFEAVRMLRSTAAGHLPPANGAEYPRGPFGEAMRQTAQLIRANVGLEVAFTDMQGWDTHVGQGAEQGQLAARLGELGGALAAFARDLGDRMADVVVLTMSEFGRTVRENGNRGTDHGHATAMLVLGGGVRGGRVVGRWPGLAPERLFEGRDLAVTTDFRTLFGEVALHHLGVTPAPLFPCWTASEPPLGLFA